MCMLALSWRSSHVRLGWLCWRRLARIAARGRYLSLETAVASSAGTKTAVGRAAGDGGGQQAAPRRRAYEPWCCRGGGKRRMSLFPGTKGAMR